MRLSQAQNVAQLLMNVISQNECRDAVGTETMPLVVKSEE